MDLYLCLDKLVNFKPVVSPAPEDGSPRPGQKDKEETERTGISPAGSQDWDGPSKQTHTVKQYLPHTALMYRTTL